MACERWREMISAQLDGEDDPADRPRVDEHLGGCADCREWLDRAAAVNRLTRTGVATPVPDLTAAILAALPPAGSPAGLTSAGSPAGPLTPAGSSPAGPDSRAGSSASGASPVAASRLRVLLRLRGWFREWVPLLYVALAGVGAVQLILGLSQVGAGAAADHAHGLAATPGHLWHESAAWNVAVGAGYLFLALRRSRPTGLVPMLSAFVGMLLLLSFNDLTAGRVDSARLVSHGFVLVGFLLVVALSRTAPGPVEPPGDRVTGGGSGWRARFEDEPATAAPGLRLVSRPSGPLTARHEERRAA